MLSLVLITLMAADHPAPKAAEIAECLSRVRDVHGAAGPWAVAGYRMGERALKDLGLPRHAFTLLVVHRSPAEVQYSCVADGLQAATGASPGKLNLRVEETAAGNMKTVIRDKKSGRVLTFTLKPEFIARRSTTCRKIALRVKAAASRVCVMTKCSSWSSRSEIEIEGGGRRTT